MWEISIGNQCEKMLGEDLVEVFFLTKGSRDFYRRNFVPFTTDVDC